MILPLIIDTIDYLDFDKALATVYSRIVTTGYNKLLMVTTQLNH